MHAPHSDTDTGPSRALRLSGYALAAWSFAYMLPHLHWALGGRFGLSAFHPSAAQLPQLREINWWASLILTLAALLGVGLVRLRGKQQFRWPLLTVAWAGASVAIAHGAYGIAARARALTHLATTSPGGVDLERDGWMLWDLLLFEPWFLVEGLLIVLAGWHYLAAPGERRRWVLACLAGSAAAAAAAVAEIRIG